MEPGFRREEIRARYDVPGIREDEWHSLTGQKAAEFVAQWLVSDPYPGRVLNAGAGVYQLGLSNWEEFAIDLFTTPLGKRSLGTCASVELLPFRDSSFKAVVCVGEVLAYCDPSKALREFCRVLQQGGKLIIDFGSSRSPRYIFKKCYGRAADLVYDEYNGLREPTWIYDPVYIKSILQNIGLDVVAEQSIHTWSAILRRVGFAATPANAIGQTLERLKLPRTWGDLIIMMAVKGSSV